MQIRLSKVIERIPSRPPGYLEEILTAAGINGGAGVLASLPPELLLDVPDILYQELVAKYRPGISFQHSITPFPIPRAEWPSWAKAIALLAKPGETGVGSIVERVVGPFGGEKFKQWYKALFHRDCGCAVRKAEWDAWYPYQP